MAVPIIDLDSAKALEYFPFRLKRDFLKYKGFESKDARISKSRGLNICKLYRSKQIFFS